MSLFDTLEWTEARHVGDGVRELTYVRAEKISHRWHYFEKNGWDVCWHEVASNASLRLRLLTKWSQRYLELVRARGRQSVGRGNRVVDTSLQREPIALNRPRSHLPWGNSAVGSGRRTTRVMDDNDDLDEPP
jgi:hypothetical protein